MVTGAWDWRPAASSSSQIIGDGGGGGGLKGYFPAVTSREVHQQVCRWLLISGSLVVN